HAGDYWVPATEHPIALARWGPARGRHESIIARVKPAHDGSRASAVSVAAATRLDVADGIIEHRPVTPEIHRDLDPSGLPGEALGELQVGRVFLLPRENELEATGGGRAAGRINGQGRAPRPMHVAHLRESDLLERQRRPAQLSGDGLLDPEQNDAAGE